MRFAEEEVMSYCKYHLNTLVQFIRGCDIDCSDKEFIFPIMDSLEGILGEVGVGKFFDHSNVVVYGLNSDDCVEHARSMRNIRSCYLNYDDFGRKVG